MKREKGFYWVKTSAEWFIAEFVGKPDKDKIYPYPAWKVPGHATDHYDHDFEYIDEDQIKNPNL